MRMLMGVSNGLNSLSLWGLQGPTSQHFFFFLKDYYDMLPKVGGGGVIAFTESLKKN